MPKTKGGVRKAGGEDTQRRERLRLYAPKHHGTAEVGWTSGEVGHLDPPIAPIIFDITHLDFVMGSIESCAGGGGLKGLKLMPPVDYYLPEAYLHIRYKDDPQSLPEAEKFDRQLQGLRVRIKRKDGDIVGGVCVDLENPRRLVPFDPRRECYFFFDKPYTLEDLDTLWQEVHRFVRVRLALQKKERQDR